MRFIRITLFRNYFTFFLTKNLKKSLIIINIGIFLSIFAVTASFISIYIENKISKLEFDLIELQLIKTTGDITVDYFIDEEKKYDALLKEHKRIQQFLAFIKTTNVEKNIISNSDIYLSSLKSFLPRRTEKYIINEMREIASWYITELSKSQEYFESKMGKFKFNEYMESLNEITNYSNKHIIFNIDKEYYNKKIFHLSYSDLLNEIENKKEEEIFEEEYSKIIEFLNIGRNLLSISANLEGIFQNIYVDHIKKINQEIINLSNKEKK